MSASALIREYAAEHVVFGSDEIRQLHGPKAALLVTRLANKGEFSRIMNGVFGPVGSDTTHEAYQAYLARMHDAMVERSRKPGSTIADRFYAWASEHGPFRVPDADRVFGGDMKGFVSSAMKRRKIVRISEGLYAYEGHVPADRRTTEPMAEADAPEHKEILDLLGGRIMTAADIVESTGIVAHRVRNLLARLAHDGRVAFSEPSSTNSHRVYRLPKHKPDALDEDSFAVLAIIASSNGTSIRGVETHKLGESMRRVHDLLARRLVVEDGRDVLLGGALYRPTAKGLDHLQAAGRKHVGVPPECQRPVERRILEMVVESPGIGYADLKPAFDPDKTDRDAIEFAVHRLADVGMVAITRSRHVSINPTQKAIDLLEPAQ